MARQLHSGKVPGRVLPPAPGRHIYTHELHAWALHLAGAHGHQPPRMLRTAAPPRTRGGRAQHFRRPLQQDGLPRVCLAPRRRGRSPAPATSPRSQAHGGAARPYRRRPTQCCQSTPQRLPPLRDRERDAPPAQGGTLRRERPGAPGARRHRRPLPAVICPPGCPPTPAPSGHDLAASLIEVQWPTAHC